jgi:uncharacterized protein YgiM (DUF1202 family)
MHQFTLMTLFTFLSVTVVIGQVDCLSLIERTIVDVNEFCADIGDNQACYGNGNILAEFSPEVDSNEFTQSGDRVDLSRMTGLELSSDRANMTQWGVALMRVKANDSDEHASMIVVGDVQIENKGSGITLLPVTVLQNMNLRSGPSTNFAVVTTLASGQEIAAMGINDGGDWLRVVLADGETVGWAFGNLVTVHGDVNELNVMDASISDGSSHPMQGFFFDSILEHRDCIDAPPNGIFIQSPKRAGVVDFTINQTNLEGSATFFVQHTLHEETRHMQIDILEGSLIISTVFDSISIPAGGQALIPLTEQALPSDNPITLKPYTNPKVTTIKTLLPLLPETITVASPLSRQTQTALTDLAPLPGFWNAVVTQNIPGRIGIVRTCAPLDPEGYQAFFQITLSDDGQMVTLRRITSYGLKEVSKISSGYYEDVFRDDSYVSTTHLNVRSPIFVTLEDDTIINECESKLTTQLTYLGEELPPATIGPLQQGVWSINTTRIQGPCSQLGFDNVRVGESFERVKVGSRGELIANYNYEMNPIEEDSYILLTPASTFSELPHTYVVDIESPQQFNGTFTGDSCTIDFKGVRDEVSPPLIIDVVQPIDSTIVPTSGTWTMEFITDNDYGDCLDIERSVFTIPVNIQVSPDASSFEITLDSFSEWLKGVYERHPDGFYVNTYWNHRINNMVTYIWRFTAPNKAEFMIEYITDSNCMSTSEGEATLDP